MGFRVGGSSRDDGYVDVTFVGDGTFAIEDHAIFLDVHVVVAATGTYLLTTSRSVPSVHTRAFLLLLDRSYWDGLLLLLEESSSPTCLYGAVIEIGGRSFAVVEVLSYSALDLNLNWQRIQVRKDNARGIEVAGLVHWWLKLLSLGNN